MASDTEAYDIALIDCNAPECCWKCM